MSSANDNTIDHQESKYKLWTAIITLLSVVFGFLYTAFQLTNQKEDIRRIEQNFQNMNQLKRALVMPLEGVWNYRVDYSKYIGHTKPHRALDGKGVAVWYGDTAKVGYHFYIGGGIHDDGSDKKDVTIVVDFFLPAMKNGMPFKLAKAEGKYIARTTSNPDYEQSSNSIIYLTDGRAEENDEHVINKLVFSFKTYDVGRETVATVEFERPAPEF